MVRTAALLLMAWAGLTPLRAQPPGCGTRPVADPVPIVAEAPADGCPLRVGFFYTTAAADALDTAFDAHATDAVAWANEANRLSGVPWRFERALVRVLPYTPSGLDSAGLSLDLIRFRNRSDGYLDGVHEDRSRADIDLMALITEGPIPSGSDTFGGSAYTIGAARQNAFVQVWQALGSPAVAHEWGHLLGLRHGNDPGVVPFAYGHGYGQLSASPFPYQTIMGGDAPCLCTGCCALLQRWSNDDSLWLGNPLGNAGTADAARALREREPVANAFEIVPALKLWSVDGTLGPRDRALLRAGDEWRHLPGYGLTAEAGSRLRITAGRRVRLAAGFRAHGGSSVRVLPEPACAGGGRREAARSTPAPARLEVLPNPAASHVRVQWAAACPGPCRLLVVDAAGRTVHRVGPFSRDAGPRRAEWSLEGWPAGTYRVLLLGEGVTASANLVKP